MSNKELSLRTIADELNSFTKPINVLRQLQPDGTIKTISPVASVWDTAPTTLANCVDGRFDLGTGEGSTNAIGAGNYGILTWNLGIPKTVLVGGRVGLYSTGPQVTQLFIESSDDGVTWRAKTGGVGAVNVSAYVSSATEEVCDLQTVICTGQFFRLRFYVGAASNTAKAKIYEVFAFEMGV